MLSSSGPAVADVTQALARKQTEPARARLVAEDLHPQLNIRRAPTWVQRARAKAKSAFTQSGDVAGPVGKLGPLNSHDSVRLHPSSDNESDSGSTFSDDTHGRGMPEEVDLDFRGPTSDGGLCLNFDWTHKHGCSTPPESDHVGSSAVGSPGEIAASLGEASPSAPSQQGANEGDKVFGPERPPVPPLRIVIMIAGTRGDVQPFIALGLQLQEYGHRVRLASHSVYRDFVQSFGLEFYPLGGDPKVLSDYIVKNRGIIPGSAKDAIDNYHQVEQIIMSTYAACTQPDEESGGEPFTAQAIIANPPAYGHIHCAEKLGVPLHMFFTMPWTPTKAFPHPLARLNNVKSSRLIGLRNYLSYIAVNELLYSGMSGIFRRFRTETLGLTPLRAGHRAADLVTAHDVPFTYCWSQQLVPKPSDWGPKVDVVGYFFLDEGERGHYAPAAELRDFLAAGPAPVYIGFGSLMVDNPKALTKMILQAVERTGQRVILSRGWGGLGDGFDIPESILLIDNTPHDWLLPQCSGVVHHGGAGTTAAGLLASCPTFVVYFFGDQVFWGSACAKAGFGPKPVAIDQLTTDKLVEALEFMARPKVKEAVSQVAPKIKQEDGIKAGMEAFHAHLPMDHVLSGEPINWNLTPPSFHNFLSEASGGVVGLFSEPVRGARRQGTKGAIKGIGKGLVGVGYRPIKGLYLAAQDIKYRTAAAAKVVDRRATHRYFITKASVSRSSKKAAERLSTKSGYLDHFQCAASCWEEEALDCGRPTASDAALRASSR
ncbi:hypothetical protein WJX72_010056 [[Myrmecia] bisecta]|uniref:Glycosyltransferase family 28 N-terminal domain-containing protein n=1 Tax=[Myrmecia] bisecta TaxID=41462 RepID=A0AAW1R8Q4_9CHLO